MKTEENNRLIAEFMGWKSGTRTKELSNREIFDVLISPDKSTVLRVESELYRLRYYISWNWLMPVVERINRCKYEDKETAYLRTFGIIYEVTGDYMVRFNRCPLFEAETLIEATYLAVVDFIEWHNKR